MASLTISKFKSSFQATAQTLRPLSMRIRELVPQFQQRKGAWLTSTMQHIRHPETGANFYGIHRDKQMTNSPKEEALKHYEEIKSCLLQRMKLPPDTLIYQVVGDSKAYSPKGTEEIMQFLHGQLPPNCALLYGYTGYAEADGTRCVNAAVSTFAEKLNILPKTIGNLVGFHTPAALESWGCTGPELDHYIIVYGDDESSRETGTVFGDDIKTSDFITDVLVIGDGGIQSFGQACNVLALDRSIIAIQDLRRDESRFDAATGKPYFSASEFLAFIKQNVEVLKADLLVAPEEIRTDLLDQWHREYFKVRAIADPKAKDYDTKKKLLDDAWNLFKSEGLHTKLHQFKLMNRSKI